MGEYGVLAEYLHRINVKTDSYGLNAWCMRVIALDGSFWRNMDLTAMRQI